MCMRMPTPMHKRQTHKSASKRNLVKTWLEGHTSQACNLLRQLARARSPYAFSCSPAGTQSSRNAHAPEVDGSILKRTCVPSHGCTASAQRAQSQQPWHAALRGPTRQSVLWSTCSVDRPRTSSISTVVLFGSCASCNQLAQQLSSEGEDTHNSFREANIQMGYKACT